MLSNCSHILELALAGRRVSGSCLPSERSVSVGKGGLPGLWMQWLKQGRLFVSCALPDFALTLGCAGTS